MGRGRHLFRYDQMEVSEVVLENLMFGGWMSLSQIKMFHPARLLLRLAWLWGVVSIWAVSPFFLSRLNLY